VRLSRDGVNFDIPELSEIESGYPNITHEDSVGTPSVFIDPLAPPSQRWKMVSGSNQRGIFLFTSPDGFKWTRSPTAVLSSWSGSQTNMFYDDQRGRYVGYHRTDIGDTRTSKTERRFVMTEVDGMDIHQTYIAHGMVRRGDEIWMYSFDTEEYHSSYRGTPNRRGVFRMVSPVDRFVAAQSPYEMDAVLYSRPLVFSGKRLSLNVDTGAAGYLQVGITQGDDRPLAGFDLDECVYVNGNEQDYTVEWLESGSDLSALAGKPVRLVIRMRGTRLYALQFAD
jgi:hypothetical protein